MGGKNPFRLNACSFAYRVEMTLDQKLSRLKLSLSFINCLRKALTIDDYTMLRSPVIKICFDNGDQMKTKKAYLSHPRD